MRSPESIKCPYCPYCGTPPHMAWAELTPWFCPNDDCQVFGWDPYSSARENLLDSVEVHWEESRPHDTPDTPPAP